MLEKRWQFYENATPQRNLLRNAICRLIINDIDNNTLQWNLIFGSIALMCNLYWLTNGSCVIILCSLNCFSFLPEQGADIVTLASTYKRFLSTYWIGGLAFTDVFFIRVYCQL